MGTINIERTAFLNRGKSDNFLKLFPGGPVAVAIGINAFLALRKPEADALLLDNYDPVCGRIRIHRHTKAGNDEWLPIIAPLAERLAEGFDQINIRRREYAIRERIKGTGLVWKGWYGFRRGMATNLFRLGYKAEEAALILRNSPRSFASTTSGSSRKALGKTP